MFEEGSEPCGVRATWTTAIQADAGDGRVGRRSVAAAAGGALGFLLPRFEQSLTSLIGRKLPDFVLIVHLIKIIVSFQHVKIMGSTQQRTRGSNDENTSKRVEKFPQKFIKYKVKTNEKKKKSLDLLVPHIVC